MGFQNFKACFLLQTLWLSTAQGTFVFPARKGLDLSLLILHSHLGFNFWYISCPEVTLLQLDQVYCASLSKGLLCLYILKKFKLSHAICEQYLERLSDSSLAIVIDCLGYSIHSKHHLCTVVQCQSLLIYHLLLLILLNPAALLLIELIRMPSPHLNSRTKNSIRDEGSTTL